MSPPEPAFFCKGCRPRDLDSKGRNPCALERCDTCDPWDDRKAVCAQTRFNRLEDRLDKLDKDLGALLYDINKLVRGIYKNL